MDLCARVVPAAERSHFAAEAEAEADEAQPLKLPPPVAGAYTRPLFGST